MFAYVAGWPPGERAVVRGPTVQFLSCGQSHRAAGRRRNALAVAVHVKAGRTRYMQPGYRYLIDLAARAFQRNVNGCTCIRHPALFRS